MYAAHDIYTDPYCPYIAYKETVLVAFHGFLSAMPNQFFKVLNTHFGQTFTIVGYNYDYFDPIENCRRFESYYRTALKGKKLIFAGTSLGGFWAHYLAQTHGAQQVILCNPVICPSEGLLCFSKKINYSDRRKQTFNVTREKLNRYAGLCLKKKINSHRLILLTENDDINDHTIACDLFTHAHNTCLITFKKGGHSIDFNTHTAAWHALESFIQDPSMVINK
jgi:predicted esterase YcpF (UPF0227 family)